MANYDITKTDTIDLKSNVDDYSVAPKSTDGTNYLNESTYDNLNFTKWYGYYCSIPELKSAIDAFATWVLGQGYKTISAETEIMLRHIKGWGEDTFLSILWNMLVVKKIHGDAYAEIIKDKKTGILINIKPLDPASMKVVCNKGGKIIRYEHSKSGNKQTFEPEEIFHISNNRIADNIHGQSIIEPVEWVVLARNEALADKRRMLHYSTIRVIEVEEDDTARLTKLKTDFASAINNGSVLLLPKGSGTIQDLVPPATEHLAWINYLTDFFYMALGVPKVILGGTSENTEASAKVAVIVYEPIFIREITELEKDIFNQLGIILKINKQPSLMDNMQTDEAKNTGQTKMEYQGTQ
jgi:hypothetical protein